MCNTAIIIIIGLEWALGVSLVIFIVQAEVSQL